MDEIGFWIVTHTTRLHGDSTVPQGLEITATEADIDRPALHMQAPLCHAATLIAQHGVGFGGAVGGDDFEFARGSRRLLQLVEHLQQRSIHTDRLAGTMIPEQMIENLQAIGLIFPFAPIGYALSFTRMGVAKRQTAILACRECQHG